MEIDEAKTIAIQFLRDRFPLWHSLPARTIGELLNRWPDSLLRQSRGWNTFADGLRQKLVDMPSQQLDAFMKWIDRQPLSILG
jgi:hypothetical protein